MLPSMIAALLTSLPFGSLPDDVVPGIVWIRSAEGIGTGWIADRRGGVIVTCLHVVGDAATVEVFFADRRDGKYRTERSYYLSHRADLAERGLLVRGKVVARSESSDLAAIRVDKLPDDAIALPLGRAVVGERVFSLGHRQDSDNLWLPAFGIVRQVGKLADGYFWNAKKLASDCPVVLVSSPILPGDSGGPAIDARGRVVGILGAVRWKAPGTSVAIDVSQLAQLAPAVAALLPKVEGRTTDRLADATVRIVVAGSASRRAGVVLEGSPTLVLTCAAAGGNGREVDVLLPLRDDRGRILAEDDRYADPIALRRAGRLVRGLVLGRDPARDLTLIELPHLPDGARGLRLGDRAARAGEIVHTVDHPSGVELGWLLQQGIVRTSARVRLDPDGLEGAFRPQAYLMQMPGSPGSSGGGLLLADGSLAGIVSTREAAQQQIAFAVSADEIRTFLNAVKPLYDPASAERRAYLAECGRYPLGESALERFLAPIVGRRAWTATETAIRRGLQLEAAGRTDEALTAYGRAIELSPSLPLALRLRGRLYRNGNDGKRAVVDATALVELRPTSAEARLELARACLVRGDEDRALVALVEAHRLGDAAGSRRVLSEYVERLKADWPDSPDRPIRWTRGYAEKVKPWLVPE